MGPITIELFPDSAPLAVENFEGLTRRGYYDGTIFHRVIEGFVIQGGDPTGTGYGGESIWGERFADEFDESLRFDRPGRVGMANAGPDTNGSQFFITVVPTPWLNDRHTIFGEVVSGIEIVQAISKVKVDSRDRPVQSVFVKSIKILAHKEVPPGFGGGGWGP